MENIFVSISPLYYFSKILGMANYKPVAYNNRLHFVKGRIIVLFGYFMLTIFLLTALFLFSHIIINNHSEDITKIIFVLQANCLLLFALSIFGSYYYFNNKLIKILNKLIEIDAILKQMGISLNYKAISKYFVRSIVIEIIWYAVYTGLTFYKNVRNFNSFMANLLFIWNALIIFLYLTGLILIFKQRLVALDRNLKEVITLNYYRQNNMTNRIDSAIVNTIRKTTNLYKRLSFMVADVNDMFSIQITVFVMLIFVIEVSLLYKICSSISQYDIKGSGFEDKITSIFWSVYFGYKFVLLTHFCGQLSQHVSMKIKYLQNTIYQFMYIYVNTRATVE